MLAQPFAYLCKSVSDSQRLCPLLLGTYAPAARARERDGNQTCS